MAGEMISIDVDGAAMPAYAIRAETPGVPGVIVLQEIFGVDAGIKAIADLVATLGYGVVAPNIFHRTHPDLDAPHDAAGTALGRAAAGAVTVEGLRADLVAAVRYLRLECEAPRVATWGFCFGGSVAFLSATLEEIDAAVSFYGGQIATSPFPGLPPLLERTGDLVAPLFFAFGGSAAHVPRDDVETIGRRLTEHGKHYALELYPDEGHGFFRDGPEGSPGARDVWPKVRAFLQRHLGA